jgi:hypothetical protein
MIFESLVRFLLVPINGDRMNINNALPFLGVDWFRGDLMFGRALLVVQYVDIVIIPEENMILNLSPYSVSGPGVIYRCQYKKLHKEMH